MEEGSVWIESCSGELVWLSLQAGGMTSAWLGIPLWILRLLLSTPCCFTIFAVEILLHGGIVG